MLLQLSSLVWLKAAFPTWSRDGEDAELTQHPTARLAPSLFTGGTEQKPGFFLLIPISPSLLLSPQGTGAAQTALCCLSMSHQFCSPSTAWVNCEGLPTAAVARSLSRAGNGKEKIILDLQASGNSQDQRSVVSPARISAPSSLS